MSCSNSNTKSFELNELPNSKYESQFEKLTYVPSFSSNRLPHFKSKTQYYGQIDDLNHSQFNFVFDMTLDSILFFYDQNLDGVIEQNEFKYAKNEFQVDVKTDSNQNIKIYFSISAFLKSNFLDPKVEYIVKNKRQAIVNLENQKFKLTLIDIEFDGFSNINKDKLLIEMDNELRTLDINELYQSYLILKNSKLEFFISKNLDYVQIRQLKEKL